MYRDEIPVAELCLRGFGKQVMHAMMVHTSDFNVQVKVAVDRALSEANLQYVMDKYVLGLMESVVKDVFQDYDLKNKIKEEVLKSMLGKSDDSNNEPNAVDV